MEISVLTKKGFIYLGLEVPLAEARREEWPGLSALPVGDVEIHLPLLSTQHQLAPRLLPGQQVEQQ